MDRKLWLAAPLAVIALSALVALLAVTAAAHPADARANGVLNLAAANADVDFSDPALAYDELSWSVEYETCAKLVDYPDVSGPKGSELVPGEAAAGFPVVSNGGKTYTFTIRKGVRFSDGAPLTAADFVYAFNRDANPAMQSPVTPFVTDIVGWNAVVAKEAAKVAGVTARGNKLTIRLTHRDGGLLNKLALPFFCAVEPAKTPIDPHGVLTLPGAGPYYIAGRTVGKQLVLKRNPYYKGKRPRRSATIVITMNTNPATTFLQVSNGTFAADPNGLDDPTAATELAKKYGINKSRFFVHPLVETDYIALNTSQAPFNSLAARKAANYAIDRPAILRTRGFDAGVRTSTILPKAIAGGYWGQKIYATAGANPVKAKQLLPHCGDVTLWGSNSITGTQQVGIARYNLSQIGCNVTVKQMGALAVTTAAGIKGADYDLVFGAWNADYADAYDFFGTLLDGRTIRNANNNDLAYLNDATLNRKIDEAEALTGDARAKAFGRLDVYTTTKLAPWVPIDNRNQRDFIGPDVGGYVFQPVFATMDLGSLYLK
jgi:peptide/nickel transport system substrate-binding protein